MKILKLLILTVMTSIGSVQGQNPNTIADIKKFVQGGEWVSITPELRPFEDRTGTGKIAPFYVSRNFKYLPNDRFEGTIVSYGDPYGQMP